MNRAVSQDKSLSPTGSFQAKKEVTSASASANKALVSNATFVLYLYFVIDFFLRFASRIPGYGVLRPTLVMVLIVSVLLFVQRDKIKDRFRDPIFKAIIILLGYLLVSLPLVEWPGSVIKGNIDTFVRAIVFLFFTALILDTERRLKWFLGIFVFCQVFRVLEPLYMNITQGYWGSRTHLGGGEFANRLGGAPADVINPNELGFVIVTAIPFLHYLLWPLGWKSKALYAFLMPILFYALILTMSRGAFVALLVVVYFIFKESRHKVGLIVIGIFLVAGAITVMTPMQKDRYLSLVSEDTAGAAGVEGRFRGMANEFKLGFSRPIVGHGLGTTSEAKANKLGKAQASHNLYAELIIEIGVFGFMIFINYLYCCYKRLRKNQVMLDNKSRHLEVFTSRLNKTLIIIFWMYAVYSINYWGLSQYYWYLFGGLVIALGRLVAVNTYSALEINNREQIDERYPLARSMRR